jgi:hypothetical protein
MDNDQLLEEVSRFKWWLVAYDGAVTKEARGELINLIHIALDRAKKDANT